MIPRSVGLAKYCPGYHLVTGSGKQLDDEYFFTWPPWFHLAFPVKEAQHNTTATPSVRP